MSIRTNLTKARSQIAFVIGLCFAAGIALSLETRIDINGYRTGGGQRILSSSTPLALAPSGRLSISDRLDAQAAWRYFERNLQSGTGLVNSVDGFASTTIWDQASYLLALISAERIGVIDRSTFNARMGQILSTLSELELFDGKLPNKVYDTRTLTMTDYNNTPTLHGVGWSALDIARITVPLNIVLYDYPEHASKVADIFAKWKFGAMVRNGMLYGARLSEDTGEVEQIQEGRLGYEEYGARAIGLLGLDVLQAAKYDDFMHFVNVGGQKIAVDSRKYSDFDAHNVVVSEPYILTAIEFGLDSDARELAERVFLAQEARYQTTGQMTAVSEDNLDQPPYFLYNSVYADGKAWNALADDGSEHDDKRTVSTKAAFGWDALYGSEYTKKLVRYVGVTKTQDKGFQSGVYEANNKVNAVATANTNGIILEAIQYKMNGPLIAGRFMPRIGESQ